jgi:phosphohistidine phosphatase
VSASTTTGQRHLSMVSWRQGGTPVKVILVRHGDAEAEIPEGLEDDARVLTVRSRISLPGHFAQLVTHLGMPDIILTSPLVRAVQTATLLAVALRFEGPLKAHRHLYPDAAVGAVEAILQRHTENTIILVGHQPTIGATAAHLLGMATFPHPVNPGAAIGISRPGGAEPTRLLFYGAPGSPVIVESRT